MRDDSTAFDWAVLGGDVPTMELMLKQPSVDVHALNRFGCAAVQWAAAAGSVPTCQWLLSKGFDLGHVNDARHGAVVKAAWKGHMPLLRWFFFDPAGPDLKWQLDLLDLEGRSVAGLARLNGENETADWLQSLIDERRRECESGDRGVDGC
jgi:ankyrin repeat protein